MEEVSYFVALTAGLLSFFTPCILPLLPMYFGYLTGEVATSGDRASHVVRRTLLINAFAFVLGLTLLNILLGFGAKAASSVLFRYTEQLRVVGGILMMLFGVYFIFGLKVGFLERERKIQYKGYTPGFFKSLILGITFSFGWTPCNGPIVATIFMMASFQQDYMAAGTLMLVYSLGFGLMFLLSALMMGYFLEHVKGVYKHFGKIKIGAGLIMMAMGLLMLLDKMHWLNFGY